MSDDVNKDIMKAVLDAKRKGDQIRYSCYIRDIAEEFVQLIDKACPDGLEKSLAIINLRECAMLACASIMRNKEKGEKEDRNASD